MSFLSTVCCGLPVHCLLPKKCFYIGLKCWLEVRQCVKVELCVHIESSIILQSCMIWIASKLLCLLVHEKHFPNTFNIFSHFDLHLPHHRYNHIWKKTVQQRFLKFVHWTTVAVLWASVNTARLALWKQNKLTFTCTFQCCSFKKTKLGLEKMSG